MHVLGIDTSRTITSVVVARRAEILACLAQDKGVSSSVAVLALIDDALSRCALTIDKIGFIAIAVGPGSFTGLRVGFGTALGLAHARGLGVMGIGSLDAMARSQAGWDGGYIVPVESSRKGEIYTALYTMEKNVVKKLTDEMALAPEELAAMIDGPARFVGNALAPYEDMFRGEIKNEIEFVNAPVESFARGLARIALERFEVEGVADGVISPRYIRRSQAEINWEKRNN
ncbi:tRNA threonylcarbamoyladenosine biosynthesis protein TsaB [hydrothermal vent metagenome]|uniref:tRNA threonylcarbamoyladenosine biosynthesis protein TsaB n=1 Tax=hydrothermal vent metagenome TaxID=652676 RepID=A0A3B1CEE7_9ZZZZ